MTRARPRPVPRRPAPSLPADRRRRVRVRQHHAVQHPALRERPRRSSGGFQTLFDVLNVAFAVPVLLFSASDYFRVGMAARCAARTISTRGAGRARAGGAVRAQRRRHRLGARRRASSTRSRVWSSSCSSAGCSSRRPSSGIAFDRTFRSFLPLTVRVERGGGARADAARARCSPATASRPAQRDRARGCACCSTRDARVDYASSPAKQRPSTVAPARRVRAGGRARSAMRLRVAARGRRTASSRALEQPGVRDARRHRWLADVGRAVRRLVHGRAPSRSRGRRDGVVAGRRRQRQRRDGGADHRVPVRADTGGADHARHRDGPCSGAAASISRMPAVALDLSRIDTIVFDKTGTLTAAASLAVVERTA